ncbi:MAG: YdeI/OmpD-associated family protein [Anaerolineae bacterium]|nr:YdeI/OmpD-associated family protein [Anaerolineae bacterium]MCI0610452.1 YdeI/OmpD-associated family protein [Anaerolineae bacterium]
MAIRNLKSFSATIAKIGINPYVSLPEDVLDGLFKQAGKTKGPIPVRGTINRKRFIQTLVKYQGAWRLYINGEMRQAAGVDVGDQAHIKIEFDPVPRIEKNPPKFVQALSKNKEAKAAFEKLTPSRQKEMLRYLNSMKTETSLERNIEKIIRHLLGEKPKGLHHLLEGRD